MGRRKFFKEEKEKLPFYLPFSYGLDSFKQHKKALLKFLKVGKCKRWIFFWRLYLRSN